MRRLVIAAAAASLAVSFAPSPASAEVIAGATFSATPTSGASGTTITVTGTCRGPNEPGLTVSASLAYPVRSDAILPPAVSGQTTTDQSHHFSLDLAVPNTPEQRFPGQDPIDMEVTVSCAGTFAKVPFTYTHKSTGNPTPIFTVPGPGACGYGFVPVDVDASLPCNAQLKGQDVNGALGGLNEYIFRDSEGFGGTVAAGDFLLDPNNIYPEFAVANGPSPSVDTSIVTRKAAPNQPELRITPFGGWHGGVNLAFADVSGDARDELIVGAGPGGGPHVKVYAFLPDTNVWDQVGSFFAYGDTFHGGVSVAGGDVNGDGKAEIITGAGPGGGPHVRVFNATGTPMGPGFYAYGANFPGGVNVASGNFTINPNDEIITGPGPGGGPHVRVFDNAARARIWLHYGAQ